MRHLIAAAGLHSTGHSTTLIHKYNFTTWFKNRATCAMSTISEWRENGLPYTWPYLGIGFTSLVLPKKQAAANHKLVSNRIAGANVDLIFVQSRRGHGQWIWSDPIWSARDPCLGNRRKEQGSGNVAVSSSEKIFEWLGEWAGDGQQRTGPLCCRACELVFLFWCPSPSPSQSIACSLNWGRKLCVTSSSPVSDFAGGFVVHLCHPRPHPHPYAHNSSSLGSFWYAKGSSVAPRVQKTLRLPLAFQIRNSFFGGSDGTWPWQFNALSFPWRIVKFGKIKWIFKV